MFPKKDNRYNLFHGQLLFKLTRLTLIGIIILLFIILFAYTGGWLSPHRMNAEKIVDAMQENGGLFPGYKRAHAKGMCITGYFDSNGKGLTLSQASVFKSGRTPLIGRFSTAGSNPFAPDGRVVFHGMALQFTGSDGQIWRTAMDDTPIFPVATGEALYDFLMAFTPNPKTGKPDPQKTAAFLTQHPETQAFMDWMKTHPVPSSFANGTYHSINAFRFINAKGLSRYVRWSLEPETAFTALDQKQLGTLPRDFLFTDLVTRVMQAPLRWHLLITLAAPEDPVDNATKSWPDSREKIDVGTIVIDHVSPDKNGPCNDMTFDPLILPSGIKPSNDPLLNARSATYRVSFKRRALDPAPEKTVLSE